MRTVRARAPACAQTCSGAARDCGPTHGQRGDDALPSRSAASPPRRATAAPTGHRHPDTAIHRHPDRTPCRYIDLPILQLGNQLIRRHGHASFPLKANDSDDAWDDAHSSSHFPPLQ
uniref:Uncharacterized protein n=1 Tax=Sphaerodactylus townsendi TaxID=933632 RepID=A0ACB8FEM8_9SAUR